MPAWLTLKVALYIAGAVVALLVLTAVYRLLTGAPKAEARLGRNTTEAALESGRDAVGSVSAQQAAEQGVDATTGQNAAEIHSAPGSDAKVDPAATGAGLRAICRRASARNDPKCVSR